MSCTFNSNQEVLNKVREKGFSSQEMNVTHEFTCACGENITMTTFETKCPNCEGIFTVTPCSQENIENVVFVK